jgi:DNA modification methylase
VAEKAEWDFELLGDELDDLFTFDMTLFGFDEFAEEEEPAEIVEDDYDITPPEEPKAKRGDIYKLGNHRLMCGDSKSLEDVGLLMGEDKASMGFTDPPWNVNYGAVKDGNAQGYKPRTILNDFMGTEDFKEFMNKAFASLNFAMADGAMTYVVMSAQEWGNMMLTLAQNNYHWSSTIIWNKDSLVLSRKDYHTKYEPIWYGWKEGTRLCPLEDRKQSDVWDIPRPKKSEEHPTMKPVELVARAITNSSKKGDVVIDLFGGSGTTLIASEQTDRCCRMMELDPKYVDVIVNRWEQLTGMKAELINANN